MRVKFRVEVIQTPGVAGHDSFGFLRGFSGSDSILKRSQLPALVLTDT